MHVDVVDLRNFYYRTQLGRAAQRAMRDALSALWPSVKGETVVGYGFAAPMLRPFLEDARRVLCFMPAPQGVCRWPPEGPNLSALVEETHWPLPVGFVDRLVVAHGLETCERPGPLLQEMNRVLAPGGKAIFIVPNRSGIWARRDATPFGYGRPYSFRQLEAQLRAHKFEPERHAAALYWPPSHRRFWLKTARAWEGAGLKLDAQRLAGVVIIEATKLVYAAPQSGAKTSARTPLEVLEGLARPPKPATGRSWRRLGAELRSARVDPGT